MLSIRDSNQQTQSLLNELTGFGLNPHEWDLKFISKDSCLILSKDDPDFAFQGKTQTKGSLRSWSQLQLISL